MTLADVVVESDRLCLTPISMDYKEIIFAEFTPDIATYMHPRPPRTIHDTETFIKYALLELKQETSLTVVILEKCSQSFLGCAGLHNVHRSTPELGIWLKKSAHGHGYGREAIAALKQWADDHLEYDHLIYPVDRANVPSRKIPESLGGKVAKRYTKMNLSARLLNIVEYHIFPH